MILDLCVQGSHWALEGWRKCC